MKHYVYVVAYRPHGCCHRISFLSTEVEASDTSDAYDKGALALLGADVGVYLNDYVHLVGGNQ